jgi:hypothetical protein
MIIFITFLGALPRVASPLCDICGKLWQIFATQSLILKTGKKIL